MAGGTAQVQGLFTGVRLDNMEIHGCGIQKLDTSGC